MNLLKPSRRKFISIWQTALSKNVCIDKLDDIVNEYNNNMIKQLKWNLLMLSLVLILNTMLILMIEILNFKLVIM